MLKRLRNLIAEKVSAPPTRYQGDDPLERQLATFEDRLREEKRRTELMARISYAKWKLRKEQEKQYAIRYGVTMPSTSVQYEQDRFFSSLEARMESERLGFIERSRAIEQQEREGERLVIEQQASERVMRVLEEDLG